MAMIATLSFLAGLFVVLLLGGASYISRGAVKRGVAILALAIGLAGTTAVEIYPALKLTDSMADNLYRTSELEKLKVERDQLVADLNQKARDNEALTKTSAFFSKLHKERMTRIAEEIRNVKDIVLGPGSGIVAGTLPTEVTLTTFVEGPGGVESIVNDLRSFKSLRVRGIGETVPPTLAMLGPQHGSEAGTSGVIVEPIDTKGTRTVGATLATPPPAPMTGEGETIAALHRALDSKMATGTYRAEPINDPEFIAGRTGHFYLIELKSPKTGANFKFDSGKYTLQNNRSEYKATFDSFAGEVLKQLEGHAKFDLFVRGSADAQAYSGPYEPGYEFRRLSYLPSTGRGKYLANLATVALGTTVRNADLPNLRGEYLRGYLAQIYPQKPAILLEGQVTKKDNPAARNTELILYVAW